MPDNQNILVFIDWYLPGYRGGGPIRSVSNMLGKLKGQINFSLVTRDTDYCHEVSYANVISNSWTESPDGFRCYYFSPEHLSVLGIIRLVRKGQWDTFYINGLYSVYFSILPLVISRLMNYPAIVAPRGMLSAGSMDTRSFRKKLYLRTARLLGVMKNVVFHATSQQEVADIQAHFGSLARIKIAPNLPGEKVEEKWKDAKSEKGVRLVSIARISPEKNTAFALEILRDVKGQVVFDLFGSVYDQNYWDKCLSIIDTLPDNICVNFQNSIEPEKIRDTLLGADFLLLPSTGENFGHIIIESFSVGTPVIISDQTPWKELEDRKIGWDISLSDKDQFIQVIEDTIKMHDDDYSEMSKNAINYASEYLKFSNGLKLNKEVFQLS